MKNKIESFENLVDALEALPSIGKKSAQRMAYHMVMDDHFGAMKIAHAIEKAVQDIQQCERCGAMSEDELCPVCADITRDHSKLCIVEHAKDILQIEAGGDYDGTYFVIASVEHLDGGKLTDRIEEGVEEVIFAFTPSIATDAMILFIEEKLKDYDLVFTKIAQGVPTGVSLENIDMLSLSRALQDRVKV
ncbi:recombination mediator RecR [Hydrogenimonas cancrithermarum]|uniref:Recombination protein RecR n=1 Tax=Hydrogenimonas cancrithermarum TaxID=2993563 RepID=A0ABM8FJ37_9BACT|nr:recombination mediator RecR [Hydrogenimonas cancrithermarum]BDY12296.1 recombination protein RecR [Hydrogenimonas cancrithermarum]